MRLDELPLRRAATVSAIDWSALRPGEARRLRELGFDEGVAIELLHRAWGGDPVACRIGRMTIALRRANAVAITVTPVTSVPA